MLYPVIGLGKPMGLIAPRDCSSSQSMEDGDEEVERFSPRYKVYIEPRFYNSDPDEGWSDVYICRDVYDPPGIDWAAMKRTQEGREGHKPHGKMCVEMVKFVTMDSRPHKRKEIPNIGAGASKEPALPHSRPTIGARMRVKPQKSGGTISTSPIHQSWMRKRKLFS